MLLKGYTTGRHCKLVSKAIIAAINMVLFVLFLSARIIFNLLQMPAPLLCIIKIAKINKKKIIIIKSPGRSVDGCLQNFISKSLKVSQRNDSINFLLRTSEKHITSSQTLRMKNNHLHLGAN